MNVMCADCGGFDVEWMRRCQKHGTEYCRGCDCPHCADEAHDDLEEESLQREADEWEELGRSY